LSAQSFQFILGIRQLGFGRFARLSFRLPFGLDRFELRQQNCTSRNVAKNQVRSIRFQRDPQRAAFQKPSIVGFDALKR
jgi:hypothetical protein